MTTVRHMLQGKSPVIHSVAPGATVFEAIASMAEHNISAVLVTEGERLVGIFTERDYARKVILQGRSSRDTKVSELMTQNLLTVSPSQTIEEVMQMMTENRIRHLPVVDHGTLIGIVTIGDAVKNVMDEQRQTIEQLSSYISGDISTAQH
ncbi:CBS domain-containing protein [Uliginosibacterium sp. sgz301328]|uniref:CBS domain-containing protein n=1 Tax=Uliginosibacterium sp. sgz301328 TaxID=3243764 RepID=UPI00359EF6B7